MRFVEGINGQDVVECEQTKTVAARDGCVVDAIPLAGILIPFMDSWARERPSTGGRFEAGREHRTAVETITATAWLAAETGVSERAIENITRRDPETREPSPRVETVELRDADPLVAAIGRTDVFWDGTLEVKPNPKASKKARAACCGGASDLRPD